jgi:predicted transcriptional regulator
MRAIKVRDLMIPTEKYPFVSHDATLREALVILAESEKVFRAARAWPRSILVLNDKGQVAGKVSYWDVLRALEPKYNLMGDAKVLCRCGWSAAFIKSMLQQYGLLTEPLADACASAAGIQVRDVMSPLCEKELLSHEQEIVDHDGSLEEVIHLLLMGNLMALYVCKGKHIVGVVRLSDVFHAISKMIVDSD